MNRAPSITAIVPSHNGGELTLACIESILAQLGERDRVIIVDNGSWDGTSSNTQRLFGERVELLVEKRSLGFAGACNRGARISTTDFLLFVNQDLTLTSGSLDLMREVAFRKPQAILGAKLYGTEGTTIQHLGGIILTNGLTQHMGRGNQDKDFQIDQLIKCDYVSGALFLVPRSLFVELRGFDVRFSPAYFEETDFCVRARAQRIDSFCIPWASGRHFEAQVTGSESSEYYLNYNRNRLRFVMKHFTSTALREMFIPAVFL